MNFSYYMIVCHSILTFSFSKHELVMRVISLNERTRVVCTSLRQQTTKILKLPMDQNSEKQVTQDVFAGCLLKTSPGSFCIISQPILLVIYGKPHLAVSASSLNLYCWSFMENLTWQFLHHLSTYTAGHLWKTSPGSFCIISQPILLVIYGKPHLAISTSTLKIFASCGRNTLLGSFYITSGPVCWLLNGKYNMAV